MTEYLISIRLIRKIPFYIIFLQLIDFEWWQIKQQNEIAKVATLLDY